MTRSSFQCLAAVLIFLLNGCYMPDNFKSELRISKTGDFVLTYVGDLVWVPLYSAILAGEQDPSKRLPEDEIKKRVDAVARDLERDRAKVYPPGTDLSATPTAGYSEIINLGKGRFFVKYERRDRLGIPDLATFVRRNNIIISAKGLEVTNQQKDGEPFDNGQYMEIRGALIKPSDAQKMIETGMGMKGEFRVTTDAKVVVDRQGRELQNATVVKQYGPYTSYIWVIDGPFSRSPYILLEREKK